MMEFPVPSASATATGRLAVGAVGPDYRSSHIYSEQGRRSSHGFDPVPTTASREETRAGARSGFPESARSMRSQFLPPPHILQRTLWSMPDIVLLSLEVAGLAIALFATALLLQAFRLVGRFFLITAVYLLFVVTCATAILGEFYTWPYLLAAVAEALAFFVVFYQNVRREFLAVAPAALTGSALEPAAAIAYALSLYFLVYTALVIIRERRRTPEAAYVALSLAVLAVSALLALVGLLGAGFLTAVLTYLSFGLFDVGLVLFFLPLFHARGRGSSSP